MFLIVLLLRFMGGEVNVNEVVFTVRAEDNALVAVFEFCLILFS